MNCVNEESGLWRSRGCRQCVVCVDIKQPGAQVINNNGDTLHETSSKRLASSCVQNRYFVVVFLCVR